MPLKCFSIRHTLVGQITHTGKSDRLLCKNLSDRNGTVRPAGLILFLLPCGQIVGSPVLKQDVTSAGTAFLYLHRVGALVNLRRPGYRRS